ncbi:MAG: 4Fe-4S dicluster domain-containing protein [Thermodesulfobacteriota bacterium]
MARAQTHIACGLKIAGKPEDKIEDAPFTETVAAMPERIPLLKARLLAQTGDRVKIGTPLYQDKQNTSIVFPSPACGEIIDIRYGPRRVIREIVIRTDENEDAQTHEPFSRRDLTRIERNRLVEMLLKGGAWPLIRDVVFRCVADPQASPAALWVAMDSQDPFQPPADIYIRTPEDRRYFETGLQALGLLCENVFVCRSKNRPGMDKEIEKHVTHFTAGRYPEQEPGVLHYRFKTDPSQNRAWFIDGQDALLLGGFLETGRFPVMRTAAVAGDQIRSRYVRTRIGAPLKALVNENDRQENRRWVTGGLFRGYGASSESYLGLYEKGIFLIKDAEERELLGFMRPGWNKPTCSRAFLSALNPAALPVDADMHGSKRACVNCGSCTRVCPVDILPQFTYKCILAEEIEEALSHGLLDCVECGLCSYVCPSKVELTRTLRETKQAYFRGRI